MLTYLNGEEVKCGDRILDRDGNWVHIGSMQVRGKHWTLLDCNGEIIKTLDETYQHPGRTADAYDVNERRIRVGDRIRIVASAEELGVIFLDPALEGDFADVEKIDKTTDTMQILAKTTGSLDLIWLDAKMVEVQDKVGELDGKDVYPGDRLAYVGQSGQTPGLFARPSVVYGPDRVIVETDVGKALVKTDVGKALGETLVREIEPWHLVEIPERDARRIVEENLDAIAESINSRLSESL